LQIHEAYFLDAQQYLGTNYEYPKDCYNRAVSVELAKGYFRRYATAERLGRVVTVKDVARIHNGGLNGYKRKSTLPYWERFKLLMK